MSVNLLPKIVTDNLLLYVDTQNREKSFAGQPTTNLQAGAGLSIYNNVPSDVSATLTQTSSVYRGLPVWKLMLTPITATGVSYLTAGSNPGIGIVTGGGGGIGGRYTGHAIFYKSTVPMHSTPLYTNYSNIGGWGAGAIGSNFSRDMGDGWKRGEVIWYAASTAGDGKYWAINPATATLNQSITIYWAGPFKEDRNDGTFVSEFVEGTRSTTQVLKDLTGNHTLQVFGTPHYSTNYYNFANSNSNYIATGDATRFRAGNQNFTLSTWVRLLDNGFHIIAESRGDNLVGYLWILNYNSPGQMSLFLNYGGSQYVYTSSISTLQFGYLQHLAVSVNRGAGTISFYVDGVLWNTVTGIHNVSISPTSGDFYHLGYDKGGSTSNYELYSYMHHTKALSANEIKQNYDATRTRINAPFYDEGTNAAPYVALWNNSTTFTMAEFGGLGPVTAHGFSSGPVTYTLTLNNLPTHTKVRYKVFWHLVDSLDNETSNLFVMNSSGGETEALRFTKIYNAAPVASVVGSGVSWNWSGARPYTYRPWANGAYGNDGYITVDTGYYDHTAASFTARHVMGADQAQSDEAMYLSHVQVWLE
jgi:hypothetical protein